MAYVDRAAPAADPTFRSRVHVAMVTAAVQIAFARVLPNGCAALLDSSAWAVAENAAIAGIMAATD